MPIFRRKATKRTILQIAEQAVRDNPESMYVTPTFIAVYHSGTDRVLFFPHDNPSITTDEAHTFVHKRIEQYNTTL